MYYRVQGQAEEVISFRVEISFRSWQRIPAMGSVCYVTSLPRLLRSKRSYSKGAIHHARHVHVNCGMLKNLFVTKELGLAATKKSLALGLDFAHSLEDVR